MGREKVAAVWDGRFVLFRTDLEMTAEEVFRWYFGREGIEEAFRTGKGDLSLGPLSMRADYRITAYSTVMYVAWLLSSWGERRLQEAWGEGARSSGRNTPTRCSPRPWSSSKEATGSGSAQGNRSMNGRRAQ